LLNNAITDLHDLIVLLSSQCRCSAHTNKLLMLPLPLLLLIQFAVSRIVTEILCVIC